ncbi:TolC family protein [Capnocytophaga bilenii]
MKKILFLLLVPVIGTAQNLWTLDACIEYAKNNNLSIKQSEVDIEATNIDDLQAKAAFFPSVNGNLSYNLNQGKNINPVTNQYENAFFQSASGGVSVELTLFAGLQNWRKLQRAKLNHLASVYQSEKMKDDIVLMIINAYGEVLSYKEQLKNQKAQLEISKESLERTRNLIEAGSLPQGDIYEAEAQILTQEQQIIATENALFIGKMGLAQLLLLKNYQDFDIVDNGSENLNNDILNKTPQEIYQHAREVMNDVKIAENNVTLAQNSLSIAHSAYSPRLSAQWGYNSRWTKNELQNFWQQLDANKGMFGGLSLTIPVFNGLNTLGNVKRQQLNLIKAKLAKEQAEQNTEKKIYQAYTDATNAKKLFEATQKTTQAKQQAFQYAQERHNVGLMNTFDFNQAKYQYENAQNEVVKAKYQYIFKLKVLEYYFQH